jgi:hypothetical protein
MFRAINLPILSSTRLCVTASDIMHPRYWLPVAWKRRKSCASRQPVGIIPVHYTTSRNTQSSALEDGQINCPKHVELIVIINKMLLIYLVGGLCYLYQCYRLSKTQNQSVYDRCIPNASHNAIFLQGFRAIRRSQNLR